MALSEVIARLGFQLDDAALKKGVAGLDGFMGKLQQMGQIIGGSVVLGAVKNFVTEMTRVGGELTDQSAALGVSTTELQKWRHTAKLSGVDGAALATSFRVLQQRQADAAEGGRESSQAFGKVGVSLRDAKGNLKTADVLLREVGLGMSQLGSSAEKTAVAQQLLGKTGSKLIPIFEGGAEALEKNLGELERLGGLLTEDTIKALDDAGDATDRLDAAWMGMKASLATSVFPVLAAGLNKVAEWVGAIKKATEGTNLWKSVLAAAGVVAIGPLIGLLKSLAMAAALPALKFAFLVLVIDDLMTFFQGGDSAIGRALDKIFGAGTSNSASQALRDIWADLAEKDWQGAADKVTNAFDSMGEAIVNAIAGQDLDSAISQHMEETGEGFGTVLLMGIISGFEGWYTWLGENIADPVVDAIVAGATAAGEAALDLATFVGEKIVEGLTAAGSAIVDAIASPFREALPVVRKAWDANSPSRKAWQLMRDIGAGVVGGGAEMQPKVARAFNAVLPMPQQRFGSATVQQNNTVQISMPGGSAAQAHLAGRSVGEHTRTWLQEAAGALIAGI